MAENFNIDLDAAARGADMVNSLGSNVAKNALSQQEQEQLVMQAVEKTKQAKIGTKVQQTELDTKGFLSEKGQVPKAQALSELKTMLAMNNKIDEDKKAPIIEEAERTWPEVMNATDVKGFISALREGRQPPAMHGNAFQATKDMAGMTEADGTPVVLGEYYQKDTDGNMVRTGKPPSEVVAESKVGSGNEKIWRELNDKVSRLLYSMRGNVVMNNIVRAKNGLELVYQYQGSHNVKLLAAIEADVASIMTGGVASEVSMQEAHYGTAARSLGEKLGYYTGKFNMLSHMPFSSVPPLADIVENLRTTLSALLDASRETVKAQILLKETGYRPIIESEPARWDKMINDALQVVGAGIPAGTYTPGSPDQHTTPNDQQTPANGAANDPLGIR